MGRGEPEAVDTCSALLGMHGIDISLFVWWWMRLGFDFVPISFRLVGWDHAGEVMLGVLLATFACYPTLDVLVRTKNIAFLFVMAAGKSLSSRKNPTSSP